VKSQRIISNELQYNAKIDLMSKLKKTSYAILVIHMFLCDNGKAIPHIKFGFFLAFNQSVWPFSGFFLALFGFLLKFSSDNPGPDCQTCERIVTVLVVIVSQ